MGFLKNILKKEFFTGFYYVVDLDTLKAYLERAYRFAQENKLESGAELDIYWEGRKHSVTIWNESAALDDDMLGNGFVFTYDDMEFPSLDALVNQKLRFLPPYFKIHLPDHDEVGLNEYKAAHPELKVEDY